MKFTENRISHVIPLIQFGMLKLKILLLLLITVFVAACSSTDPQQQGMALPGVPSHSGETRTRSIAKPELNYSVVKVFYATDRNKIKESNTKNYYGAKRGKLSFGTTYVSIPRNHDVGELESPKFWRLEFRENPEKHVVLLDIEEATETDFFRKLSQKTRDSKKQASLIYIHGYKTTFEDAARRTAQMAFDLKFKGAPVFYSWPSSGAYLKYFADETEARNTQTNLKSFLKKYVKKSGSKNIYLIAHSIGARSLTNALKDLVLEDPSIRHKFKEIVLAAPDIDAGIFKNDIAPKIVTSEPSITVYASDKDKALLLSRQFRNYKRLGDAGDGITMIPGVEMIDASAVETDFIAHAYHASSSPVLNDISSLLHERKRADERGLAAIQNREGRYWLFSKNVFASMAFSN